MTGPPWWTPGRDLPVEAVAVALGATVRRSGIAPCPACKAEHRERHRPHRPAVGLRPDRRGWHCHKCQAHGDALDFAAAAVTGELHFREAARDPERAAKLRAWLSDRGWADPEPRPELQRPAPVVKLPPVADLPPDGPEAPPMGEAELAEVADLWSRAPRLGLDGADEARAWLTRRRLDWRRVAALDLVRGLPGGELPRWARAAGCPWSDGWRALVPTWGPSGELAGLRARWTSTEAPPRAIKGAAPALGLGSTSGRIMADPIGVALLRRGPEARPGDVLDTDGARWDGRVLVCEGEPDLLRWATDKRADRWAEQRAEGTFTGSTWATLGIVSGAWSRDFAARIPDGATVIIRRHLDDNGAGDRMADRVIETFNGRPVRLRRRAHSATDDTDEDRDHAEAP